MEQIRIFHVIVILLIPGSILTGMVSGGDPDDLALSAETDYDTSIFSDHFSIFTVENGNNPGLMPAGVPLALTILSSDGKELALENAILNYVNIERMQKGLIPYTYNAKVASVAKTHTGLMITTGYGDHSLPGEPTLATRLTAAGVAWTAYGENIAFGYPDIDPDALARAIVYDWVWNDAGSNWGHRHNILDGISSDPGYNNVPYPTSLQGYHNFGINQAGVGAGYGSVQYKGTGYTYTGWHVTMDYVKTTLPAVTKSKIGIFNSGNWYIDENGDGLFGNGDPYIPYGAPGWIQLVGDWNGDGKSEIGIYKDGLWYLDYGGSGVIDADTRYGAFGGAGWIPLVGDWNADGRDEIGVYQGGNWYLDYDGTCQWGTGDKNYGFGAPDWVPVTGKWTHDGRTKIGIFNGGNWYLDINGDGMFTGDDKYIPYGEPGWTSLVGDWNGDRISEIGIYKDSAWILDYGRSGSIDSNTRYYAFGAPGWSPLAGDWNSDVKDEIGVYQDGNWYLDGDGNGVWGPGDKNYGFGAPGWIPLIGKW